MGRRRRIVAIFNVMTVGIRRAIHKRVALIIVMAFERARQLPNLLVTY